MGRKFIKYPSTYVSASVDGPYAIYINGRLVTVFADFGFAKDALWEEVFRMETEDGEAGIDYSGCYIENNRGDIVYSCRGNI